MASALWLLAALQPAAALVIGIDAGTQSLKALVYDPATRAIIGRGAVSYGLNPVPDGVIGRAEQEPATWVDAMYEACASALAEAGPAAPAHVDAIGVSGQQHGLVALDADMRVIRPAKLWCDTESAAEAEELSRAYGWDIVASYTATKLLWLRRHEPDAFARLAHVALPHDYLNLELSGDLVMECGDASGTGLLDVRARAWNVTAARAIDAALERALPPLIGPADAAGRLRPAAAARLGLSAGVPIAPGGGDNMMSALGCGCAAAGRAAVSLGTSGTLFTRTDAAIIDRTGTVAPFLDATGGGLPLVCTLNCADVPEEVRATRPRATPTPSPGRAAATIYRAGARGVSSRPRRAHRPRRRRAGGQRRTDLPPLPPRRAHAKLAGRIGRHRGAAAGTARQARVARPTPHRLQVAPIATCRRPGLLYRAALEGSTFALRAGLDCLRANGVDDPTEARLPHPFGPSIPAQKCHAPPQLGAPRRRRLTLGSVASDCR